MIKFLNIAKQDKPLNKKIISDIKKIIIKKNFILGSNVSDFEKNFANFCKSKFAISCANGTDALTISLKILGLPKNSEVRLSNEILFFNLNLKKHHNIYKYTEL